MLVNRQRVFNAESIHLRYCILALFLISLPGALLHAQNPLYYLWGFRNQYRFFLFFMACTMFMRNRSVITVFSIFDYLFYINFVVTLVQYCVFGKRQDYLGGIFGVRVGCNAKTIIFMSIVVTYSMLNYLHKREESRKCMTKCVIALVVAALAELKFFLILFLLLALMALLRTEFSVRKFVLIILAVVGVYVGVQILIAIFPMWNKWFTVDSILETALSRDGYTGRGDMNRLTSIPIVWSRFLSTFYERLFGLGLGNCDTSSFSFLITPFYQRYGHLRYNWFSAAFLILELGLAGLICYVCFFSMVFKYARKREREGLCDPVHSQLAQTMAMVSLLLSIYNGSMRSEEAYMIYFILSLPFLQDSALQNKRRYF